ncbi:hypothetical protein [Shimia sp. SK013]|uniref:hypothetical protein n=1 Tax=Shimia sp. SK013 TaxID=1389006 RepID=UPI00128FC494|nr:hypothetical protein [Shimia sp. SK013]
MIIASPCRNTEHPEPYQVLHTGFDTIVLAIKTILPPEFHAHLEAQKAVAEAEQREVQIDYNGVKLLLGHYGGGGYSYVANGGEFGARWAFKKPNAKDPWGVRVTIGSTFLATLGLGAARAHVDGVLEKLGMRFQADDISLSRVDICTDILAPDFVLDQEVFVMHQRANRRGHFSDAEMSVNGRSSRTTSVTIGKSNRRQVIIYDKRLEVIEKRKAHWWAIWNQTRRLQGFPPLDPKNRNERIWRIEFRAGKSLLKDTWNIRTWADLFARFGDLCAQTGSVVRYTDPAPNDGNRARWPNHPIWDIACAEIAADLSEMREGTDPNPVKAVIREQHISTLTKNIRGSTLTLAALHGVGFSDLSEFFDKTAKLFEDDLHSQSEHMRKLFTNAQERYQFITERHGKAQ